MWHTPRGDARNLGRGPSAGAFVDTPVETWHMATGADIRFARSVDHPEGPAVLVQAGTTLQLLAWSGRRLWSVTRLGVRRVLYAGRVGTDSAPVALVVLSERTVGLIDLTRGELGWTWASEPSSNLSSPGASKLYPPGHGRLRWVCFPAYSTRGVCFELSGAGDPRLVWQTELGDRYDTGFGPNVIVADVLATGRPQVVLSSRTGSRYSSDDLGVVTTAEVVLGRLDGRLYQAVLDDSTGRPLLEGAYRPDPGDYPCARPYGLFEAVPQPDRVELVLVSCQVEEYLAVTRVASNRLSRSWGVFIERDWPTDRLELRPQVTSLADLGGDGTRSLIVGLWDGDQWATLIIDTTVGYHDGIQARVNGRYFWGCHDIDGDGRPELLVSREPHRTPARRTRLEALDPMSLEPKAVLDHAGFIQSTDSELPPHRNFLADRANPVAVTDGQGHGGVLVCVPDDGSERVAVWSPGAAAPLRDLAPGRFSRADWHDGELILSDPTGQLRRFDRLLRPAEDITGVHGRSCQPLAWCRSDGPEVVVDLAGHRVAGGQPAAGGGFAHGWAVTGALPALDTSDGTDRLAIARLDDPVHAQVVIHTKPGRADTTAVRVPLDAPPLVALTPTGPPYRLIVNLRTGVHTAALVALDAAGVECWRHDDFGAHPRRPGIAPDSGGDLVLVDDHGVLRILDLGSGDVVAEIDWTAAYTVPMALPDASGDTALILRVDGIHGSEALDLAGQQRWRRDTELWRYFPGSSAAAQLGRDGHWVIGSVSRQGTFDAVDADTGRLRWQHHVGSVDTERAVTAGDIDGDGRDEFLVGTTDGRLVCLGEAGDGQPRVLWECHLPGSVANPVLTDVDGDGVAEILVATADGYLRLLRPG